MLHLCAVAVGLVQTCSATAYTGTAPVERGDRVYECQVVIGSITSCSLPHTGLVVLPRGQGGKHVSCTVDHGIVSRCSATGFTGDAVVARP